MHSIVFMTKTSLKYYGPVLALILLTSLTLVLNYSYMVAKERNLYLINLVNRSQTLINNRNHVVSVLQALESIIDNNTSASYQQILKIKAQLPETLVNSDYAISPSLGWRYNKLKLDLAEYIKPLPEIGDSLLLNLTALKLEISSILASNKNNHSNLNNQQKKLASKLGLIFKFSIVVFVIMMSCFYYLLFFLKQQNKFKLKDLSNLDNSVIGTKADLNNKSIIDYLIKVEHFCQRLSYYNTIMLKQIVANDLVLSKLIDKQNNIADLLQKISIKNNLTFALLAELMEVNNNIIKELHSLIQENLLIKDSIDKNSFYIASIFSLVPVINKTTAPIKEIKKAATPL